MRRASGSTQGVNSHLRTAALADAPSPFRQVWNASPAFVRGSIDGTMEKLEAVLTGLVEKVQIAV